MNSYVNPDFECVSHSLRGWHLREGEQEGNLHGNCGRKNLEMATWNLLSAACSVGTLSFTLFCLLISSIRRFFPWQGICHWSHFHRTGTVLHTVSHSSCLTANIQHSQTAKKNLNPSQRFSVPFKIFFTHWLIQIAGLFVFSGTALMVTRMVTIQ